MQKRFDTVLFVLWLLLMLAGVVAIFTASATRIGDDLHVRSYYLRQIAWILVSVGAVVLLLRIPYRIIEIFFTPMYVLTVLSLGVVLLFPATNGAHRWVQAGPMRLQPSELAKLAVVLMSAKVLAKPFMSNGQMLLRTALVCGIPGLLVLVEPDLGTALVFGAVFVAALLAADYSPLYLFILVSPLFSALTALSWPFFAGWLLLLLVVLHQNRLSVPIISIIGVLNLFTFLITPVLWNSLKTYQQNRILTFLDPARDPLGAGYQILQARIAVGSGGLMGKGFLQGTQKNLDFLPERHTDFIFSVIGEEFGFVGSMLLLALLFALLLRILHAVSRLQNREHRIAATGIFAFLAFQVLVNVGMNLGLIPTTGLPLPFISYGGSSLLFCSLGVGLVLKMLLEKTYGV